MNVELCRKTVNFGECRFIIFDEGTFDMDEIKISFTQFMKYSFLNPNKRLQQVKEWKYTNYDDESKYDYWKRLKLGIVKFHKEGLELSFLDQIPSSVPIDHRDNYRFAVNNYKKFLKRNPKAEWFKTQKKYYHYENLHINVGPELGLRIKGVPHFIKLYCTDDGGLTQKLDRGKADLMLHLMKLAIPEQLTEDSVLALINIKNDARIMRYNSNNEYLDGNLVLNMKSFIDAWNMV
ncbi:hypothetical protein EGH10_20750 [Brevibacillus laterosporus]|uniref:Uncharacterized protein n=1 Tax=Brevibacillus laterosporus LMG 15441 TaxID=1042163 RepID=A0A075R856_BRELA|nr:hypothetical protein [Brevibacillus laterosporus]AIG27463.1 hypothetical protein BRLA_c031510 [Brevibacillus laterosporus LMG 15441]RJL15383.1 hypothetical protein DM460_00365 [Brevibacillus laterosporus]TPH06453.1 hypothetical protein EGH10_20750 [Brevibacillus laterosporus]